jgi:hypothetical protein
LEGLKKLAEEMIRDSLVFRQRFEVGAARCKSASMRETKFLVLVHEVEYERTFICSCAEAPRLEGWALGVIAPHVPDPGMVKVKSLCLTK